MKSNQIILFDVRELELIDSQARKNKMSNTDYVRMCCFLDMILSGIGRALSVMSDRLKGYLSKKISEALKNDKVVS